MKAEIKAEKEKKTGGECVKRQRADQRSALNI
jgi:hypothetical protein